MSIEKNLQLIRRNIERACEQSERGPETVRLIAVTKTVDRPMIEAAYAAGIRDFGENRIQDAREKFADALPPDSQLHLIGHLQTNKAKDAARLFSDIHSLDRESIIKALGKRAAAENRNIRVLIQVNVADETQKHGCSPDEISMLIECCNEQTNLEVRGLMTIAPLVDKAEEVRPYFRQMRELRDSLAVRYPDTNLSELSMGMTNDYEVAIEEGATMIRLGRAVFGT